MTMLSNIRPFPPAATRSRGLRILAERSRRLIDRLVAAAIARHQREAEHFVLRRLTDRELMDIGLYRDQVGPGLEAAPRTRAHPPQFHR